MLPAPFYPSTARPACRSADSGRGQKYNKSSLSVINILVFFMPNLWIYLLSVASVVVYMCRETMRRSEGWGQTTTWRISSTLRCRSRVQVFRQWQSDHIWSLFISQSVAMQSRTDAAAFILALVIHLRLKWLIGEGIMWLLFSCCFCMGFFGAMCAVAHWTISMNIIPLMLKTMVNSIWLRISLIKGSRDAKSTIKSDITILSLLPCQAWVGLPLGILPGSLAEKDHQTLWYVPEVSP